jgi:serine protease Do
MRHFRQIMVVLVAAGLWQASLCGGAESEAKRMSLSFRDAVKKVKPAVVYIEAAMKTGEGYDTSYGKASGSGVIIDAKKGYILTAAHLVDEATEVEVRLEDGRKFTAKNTWADAAGDVGLVQIEGKDLPEASLGDSDKLEVGDWVLAIGSPFGRMLENSVSAGIVSAKGRKTGILGQMGIEDFIQTDAVINRGNSGGPLVNIDGEVVGINSNIISSTGMSAGLGFAVPSNMAKAVIGKLTREGKVVRGYMGVSLVGLDELDAAKLQKLPEWIRKRGGIYIGDVIAEGPAEAAGMKAGDVILSLDDKTIANGSDLVEYVSMKSPGDVVKCHVWREGKALTLSAKLAARPTNEEAAATAAPPQGADQTFLYRAVGVAVSDYAGLSIGPEGVSRLKAVVVEYVRGGSAGDRAGISAGDVIVDVNGVSVTDSASFEKQIRRGDLRKGISVTILDDNGERKVVLRRR